MQAFTCERFSGMNVQNSRPPGSFGQQHRFYLFVFCEWDVKDLKRNSWNEIEVQTFSFYSRGLSEPLVLMVGWKSLQGSTGVTGFTTQLSPLLSSHLTCTCTTLPVASEEDPSIRTEQNSLCIAANKVLLCLLKILHQLSGLQVEVESRNSVFTLFFSSFFLHSCWTVVFGSVHTSSNSICPYMGLYL